MDCRDVRELADSFLTEQLLVETNHDLVRHLETCPGCRAELASRRLVRDGLRGALARAEDLRPRQEFRAELAQVLRAQAHAPLAPAGDVTRRSLLRSWWALAAGVVAAAGVGERIRGSRSRAQLASLARLAAGDHLNCAIKFALAERPIPLEDAGRRDGGPFDALATFALPAIGEPLDELARHACVFDGQRFGHIVVKFRGAVASLLVTDGAPPSEPQVETGDRPASVASLPAGRYVGFVVADLDRADVLALARAMSGPLGRRFA